MQAHSDRTGLAWLNPGDSAAEFSCTFGEASTIFKKRLRASLLGSLLAIVGTPGDCLGLQNGLTQRGKGQSVVAEATEKYEKSTSSTILFSDVVVKRRRKFFRARKWSYLDVRYATVMVLMHVLCLFAPFTYSLGAGLIALILIFITGQFGMTLSYHRNLAHRSFKLPKWLEYLFAYCGVHALHGDPIDWVSRHRYHHKFSDSEKDPHSPTEGFWFSHIYWMFDNNYISQKCGDQLNIVEDLQKQLFYRFLRSTYLAHSLTLGALLYVCGGFPYVVWGMGVRSIFVFHGTFLVRSVCHIWGYQTWNTGDLSKNNWFVAMIAFGEGWHNNHHAFEYSARHGLESWEIDLTWNTIKLLQIIGLATDVKVPSVIQKQKMLQTVR
ncbi:hypothetical protein GIB67_000155 [Kingdonia uniflora]|uniref:Fatty acid desaturase domain-containing protein n=1 Tax=Kingdonia uniflora TaxID=39325 RepID=A0A7J7P9E9_9MAGN|nr:hypothetical protein GIB67_000155 [Kingdonia uniflora]